MHFQTHTKDHVVNTCCVHSLSSRLRLFDVLVSLCSLCKILPEATIFCLQNHSFYSLFYIHCRVILEF